MITFTIVFQEKEPGRLEVDFKAPPAPATPLEAQRAQEFQAKFIEWMESKRAIQMNSN